MTHYKNLLLALGVTISGFQLVEAKENLLTEETETSSPKSSKPSSVFLEVHLDDKDKQEGWNAGCSVSNSGCGKGALIKLD